MASLAVGSALLAGCSYQVDSLVDAPDATPGDRRCEASLPAGRRGGLCTLRAAVMESNATIWTETVNLPAGTYPLTLPLGDGGGRLVITRSLRLQGAGAATTIVDQDVQDAVIHIEGGNVEINHITVQGGNSQAGGGIRIDDGTTNLNDLIVRDNFGFTGGGGLLVNDDGRAYLRRSTIAGNEAQGAFGGGIWNRGELFVFDSTITDNESNRAGGIRNSGILNLRNVTVSGNRANSPEAGVGGISQNEFAVLNNVTITGNQGVGNAVGSFRGGGIQTSSGELTVLKNSVIAGNDGGAGPDDCVGALTPDSKYNLIGSSDGCTITSFVSTYLLDLSANLGPLASNGGSTQTHAPTQASPALNAGYAFPPPAVDACEARDQRGVPRPQGTGGCDLGAVEITAANLFVTGFVLVNAATDTDIRPLLHGDTLVLADLPDALSVRAAVSGVPASVVFGFDANAAFRIENVAPFSLGGDAAGNYTPVALLYGEHTLTATPFAGADGTGAAGGARLISFTVR